MEYDKLFYDNFYLCSGEWRSYSTKKKKKNKKQKTKQRTRPLCLHPQPQTLSMDSRTSLLNK